MMSPLTFRNIVYVACEVEKIDWAENFIEEHVKYLDFDPKAQQSIKVIYSCQLDFAKGHYTVVAEKLNDIEILDHTYMFTKDLLSLKTNYELGNFEAIHKRIPSYRAYVRDKYNRKYISEDYKLYLQNFAKILLFLIDFPYSTQTKEALLAILDKMGGFIAEGKWLREKILALKT